MYSNYKLQLLQNVQSNVFDAFEKYIKYHNTEIDRGEYLEFIEKVGNMITVRVGAEKFTIHSQIYLKDAGVTFRIYAWIFDMSKPERYRHDHIPELDFFFDGDRSVNFKKPRTMKTDYDGEKPYSVIMNFSQADYMKYLKPFFEQLEEYTDKKLSDNDGGIKVY